jgi:hypothetical protein
MDTPAAHEQFGGMGEDEEFELLGLVLQQRLVISGSAGVM